MDGNLPAPPTAGAALPRYREQGRVVPVQMVHHNPSVEVLLASGMSPYDDQYLESLCNRCHLAELRGKGK